MARAGERRLRRAALIVLLALATLAPGLPVMAETVRVAAFNTALSRPGAGVMLGDIRKRRPQVLAVAEIILRVRPDVLWLGEVDHDPEGLGLRAFRDVLAAGVNGLPGLDYPHLFAPGGNTGVPSGMDLDRDGRRAGPDDAWGYGNYPGHYAMALLSRFPIDADGARTFAKLKWSAMPGARRPIRRNGKPFHSDAVWAALRLSSKSHWDVPVETPGGTLRILASHPTPPAFDGPERRNVMRNADEIRFWGDYLRGEAWISDDAGAPGGFGGGPFVIVGDLNADPADGSGLKPAIGGLLANPALQDPRPASAGGAAAGQAQGGRNAFHDGEAALDTADWRDDPNGPGNLRVDYALPSADLGVQGSGVFWPAPGTEGAGLVGAKSGRPVSSDHRLVWVDVALPE